MKKREFCYIQHPSIYEIPPCSCGSKHYTWSEFEDHLWCFNCEADFKPENWGIFDTPISLKLCNLMGIYFYRVELNSGDYFAPDINNNYHKVLNFDKLFELNLDLMHEFELFHLNHTENTTSFKIEMHHNNSGVYFLSKQNIEDNSYISKITTYSKKRGFEDWDLSLICKNNELLLDNNNDMEIFKTTLMMNYLNLTLKKSKSSLINKI